jgi:protoporphyrinogen IX oxidase
LDATFNALLIAHLFGLMLVAAAFLPLLGLMGQGGAAPQTNRLLTQFGHWGIIVLLVSGPLMLWVRYGGFDGISHWFWAKMGLVVILAAGVVLSAISARKMRAGDAAAAARVRLGRIIATAALFGTVVFAVLAFT